MLESNPENQIELRQRGVHLSLYNLITCTTAEGSDEQPMSPALNVLLRLASDDSPSLDYDVAALLELLQQDSFSGALKTRFKVQLLQTLSEMMRRNDRVKDVFRVSNGFETALAVLMSLETILHKKGEVVAEEELHSCMPLVEAVFSTLTIAMAGSLDNREYMTSKGLYSAIASSLHFLNLIGSPADVVLLQHVVDCATEESFAEHDVYLCNPDPLLILYLEYDHLTLPAKRNFLQELQGLLKGEVVGAVNCHILLTSQFEAFLLDRLLPTLGTPADELFEDVRLLLQCVLAHQARPKLLRAVIELLYEATPGDKDIAETSTIKDHQEPERRSGIAISRAVLQTLRIVAETPRAATHIRMSGVFHSAVAAQVPKTMRRERSNRSTSALAHGQVLVEGLGERSWPPALGYSISLWIYLPRHWTGEAALTLFEIQAKLPLVRMQLIGTSVLLHLCDPAYLNKMKSKRRSRFRREPSGSDESRMVAYSVSLAKNVDANGKFSSGWHHLLFVHTPEKLLDKASGGVNVFFDSIPAAFVRCPYFPVIPELGKETAIVLGESGPKARWVDGQDAGPANAAPMQWALGGVLLIDGPLNVIHAQKLFILGPWYRGAMTCAGEGVRDSRSYASAMLERLHECSRGVDSSSVVEMLSRLGIARTWRDVIHAAHTFFGNHSNIGLSEDSIVLALHGGRASTRVVSDESGKRQLQTRLLGIDPTSGGPASGVVEGGASVVDIDSLAVSVRSMGGASCLLPLLQRTFDSDTVRSLLLLIKRILFGDAVNRYMFRKDKGHFILAWLLFSKREDGDKEEAVGEVAMRCVMTPKLLESILQLAITGEGRSAVITDPEMLNHVILNYQVWRGSFECDDRWTLIELVLQWLANLASPSNHNKALNCAILQRQNVVGWVLEIMLMLTVDIPSTNTLIVSVLAAALELLDSIVREKPTNRTLYAIFQYILVTLSHASSTATTPESAAPTLPKMGRKTHEGPVHVGLSTPTLPSPISKRRSSVAELVGRTRHELQVNQGINNAGRSARSSDILCKIRRMLFQLLMNLPREQGGETSAAENQALRKDERVLLVYAEVLSVRWFASVLDERLDRETVMLALEVLALSMQVSEDFSHHFVTRGGLDLVGRVFEHSEDLPGAVVILLMLLFGFPVSQLPSFVPYDTVSQTSHSESEPTESTFLSPQTKHQLLRRQSSIRSASSMGMAEETHATLEERITKHVCSQPEEALDIPVWATSVLRCLIKLIQNPISHADARFSWVATTVVSALERMASKAEASRRFLETAQNVQLLAGLIFVESGPHWDGPATKGVLSVFTSLLRLEMKISPTSRPSFRFAPPSLSPGGNRCVAVTLTKTILDAFDTCSDAAAVLKYQHVVFQQVIPLVEEESADKENVVHCLRFWAARASFGWCPMQESLILTKVVSAAGRVNPPLASKLINCARGLTLWAVERAVLLPDSDAPLHVTNLCQGIVQHLATLLGTLERTAPRDASIPTMPALKELEDWIEHNYHLDREEWIFFLCLFLHVNELRARYPSLKELEELWSALSDADKFLTGFLLGPNAVTNQQAALERLRENLLPVWQFVDGHVLFGARNEVDQLRPSRSPKSTSTSAEKAVSYPKKVASVEKEINTLLKKRKKSDKASDVDAVDELYKAAHALINSSHHEAADRHLKWQRATLEHLLKVRPKL